MNRQIFGFDYDIFSLISNIEKWRNALYTIEKYKA